MRQYAAVRRLWPDFREARQLHGEDSPIPGLTISTCRHAGNRQCLGLRVRPTQYGCRAATVSDFEPAPFRHGPHPRGWSRSPSRSIRSTASGLPIFSVVRRGRHHQARLTHQASSDHRRPPRRTCVAGGGWRFEAQRRSPTRSERACPMSRIGLSQPSASCIRRWAWRGAVRWVVDLEAGCDRDRLNGAFGLGWARVAAGPLGSSPAQQEKFETAPGSILNADVPF